MAPCSFCHVNPPRPRQRTCRACHNAYQRENRPRYRDLSAVERRKALCRSYTNALIRRGKLERGPCETCAAPKAEAHHESYRRPRVVRWLCAPHHRVVHLIARRRT